MNRSMSAWRSPDQVAFILLRTTANLNTTKNIKLIGNAAGAKRRQRRQDRSRLRLSMQPRNPPFLEVVQFERIRSQFLDRFTVRFKTAFVVIQQIVTSGLGQ
jgi:hypothetical protein